MCAKRLQVQSAKLRHDGNVYVTNAIDAIG